MNALSETTTVRNERWPSSLQKNKRMLFKTLLILGSCWLLNSLFQTILLLRVYVDPEGIQMMSNMFNKYLCDLVMLNSICDPIIYSTRLEGSKNLGSEWCLESVAVAVHILQIMGSFLTFSSRNIKVSYIFLKVTFNLLLVFHHTNTLSWLM